MQEAFERESKRKEMEFKLRVQMGDKSGSDSDSSDYLNSSEEDEK